ncbi:L domain-like protein [Mytilinidion resinicola]|uniref:U2 small nuclear ribonucleoprotein A' n=1 Tax=Mytilinidion resinicola TaxID=574789 RepID=A0A6A6Z4Y1_9PEZI|nr:L domain-like protein [Mytilinidion resinicola]KAF2816191.1 L domain-like protein [Mytilinidion resinicola]
MRLTVDVIHGSLSYINPLLERELDLRGHKIPAIENLGAAKDQDAIDFTDNDLSTLANFPLSPRIRTLLLARNRITTIQPTLSKSIPGLFSLVLTENNISELSDLNALGGFTNLTHLVLLENPVTRDTNYRSWVIFLCPAVRFLDFKKVRDPERSEAKKVFGTTAQPSALASEILGTKSRTFDAGSAVNGDESASKENRVQLRLTAPQQKRLETLLKKATTIQEIAWYEKEISEGRIPRGVLESGSPEIMEE